VGLTEPGPATGSQPGQALAVPELGRCPGLGLGLPRCPWLLLDGEWDGPGLPGPALVPRGAPAVPAPSAKGAAALAVPCQELQDP